MMSTKLLKCLKIIYIKEKKKIVKKKKKKKKKRKKRKIGAYGERGFLISAVLLLLIPGGPRPNPKDKY